MPSATPGFCEMALVGSDKRAMPRPQARRPERLRPISAAGTIPKYDRAE
jgi:hypothetical protein